ncbi:hypothetical protein C8Q73DRAFT_788146 [Cubamyces lactineus]|nr:hypothetical protein C8Q73DRAFT_788146 [Cubamyces lactineus]
MGAIISKNGADTLRELVNRRDIPEKDLSSAEISDLLKLVANKLVSQGKNLTIVAVGGAVNTVLLHSRPATGDVDFFYNTKTQNPDVTAITQAAQAVAKDKKLGDAWLNNHTAVFLHEDTINALYEEARRQNRPLFTASGLTVLAAPWRYAITTKIDRLMKAGAKSYDLDDAITYLHEIVSAPGGRPVPKASLATWATEFKCTPPDANMIQRIADGYQAKYKSKGIET